VARKPIATTTDTELIPATDYADPQKHPDMIVASATRAVIGSQEDDFANMSSLKSIHDSYNVFLHKDMIQYL